MISNASENLPVNSYVKENLDKVVLGDCVEEMKKLPDESVDLIFADPPYNIGIGYDNYEDNLPRNTYIRWTTKWMTEAVRVLKKNGSIYVAINDEYVAEYAIILKSKKLKMRNWIIWHYTFGESQRKKFSRSHTHILYFVKSEEDFTFNKDDIKVRSVRQEINDKRANPTGKVPDDVWKEKLNESEPENLMTVSRVAGTFKERVKDFPCQMPMKVLDRIIKASSNEGDLVLDPFSGSGTTLAAAKINGRHFIGIEQSKKYKKMIEDRLNSIL